MKAERGPVRMRQLDTRRRGDQAKVALLDSIASGSFPDGFLPSEERLAEEIGVSRGTMREALRSLEEEGRRQPPARSRDADQPPRGAYHLPGPDRRLLRSHRRGAGGRWL